ncbi:hypothetical protein JCM8097_008644 [Rhodosporidiobolus ruineniae]
MLRFAHKLVEVELLTDLPSLGLRGARVPVSPGTARNRLIPRGEALYVGRDGVAVSPLKQILRKEAERASGLMGVLARQRAKEKEERARRVLEEMGGAADPHAAARQADSALLSSLTALPQPLLFTRLTTSPTSTDLFGSVSAADVLSALKDAGIALEAGQGSFGEEQEGVEKGRVKTLGLFEYRVQLKAIEREAVVQIKVDRSA